MRTNHRMLNLAGRRGGFTLVEMLLVLVILATLAAIVVPKVVGRGEQARHTAAQADIKAFSTALDAFEVDNGAFPSSSDGLDALVNQPANAKNWKGPYVQTIKSDPWSHPYIYTYPGRHNANSYDLSSAGFDGQPDTQDDTDLNNWSN